MREILSQEIEVTLFDPLADSVNIERYEVFTLFASGEVLRNNFNKVRRRQLQELRPLSQTYCVLFLEV